MIENLEPNLDPSPQGIEVVIRIKPRTNEHNEQLLKKCVFVSPIQPNTVIVETANKKQYFSFDHIASETSTQQDLYQSIGYPLIQQYWKGYNCCIFAYGQTGAGKTYSILGNSQQLLENKWVRSRGLLPRILEQLLEAASDNVYRNCQVRCSYLQIYNEQIIDLLSKQVKVFQIRQDFKKGVYVDGLSEEIISTYQESLEVIMKGLKNRKIAATNMNSQSSRSHTIFSIMAKFQVQENSTFKSKTSKFHIIDLAGSQRMKLTKVEGDRLKQGCNINKSLHALGNVINSLVEATKKKKYIPYRDSKLTFFLKDSLGGNSKTKLLAAINPNKIYLGDTISTLMFAKRAKIIKMRVEANQQVADNVQTLRNQIKRLRQQLAHTKFISTNQTRPEKYDTEAYQVQRYGVSFRQKNLEISSLEIEQKILKVFEQNQMNYRAIIQIKQQRLDSTNEKIEKIQNSKIKQLFEAKRRLEQENSKYQNIISNTKAFTKIFTENLQIKKKNTELQQKIKAQETISQVSQIQTQNFRHRINFLESDNEQLVNQNEELKQQIQQIKIMMTVNQQTHEHSNRRRTSTISKRDQAKELINKQNLMLQQYEVAIETMKVQFQEYIQELIQQYGQLERMYQEEKKEKMEIRKERKQSIVPDVGTLQNQNQYLRLEILQLQNIIKEHEQNLFHKDVQIKTYHEQILQLKAKIEQGSQSTIGINPEELAELLQRLKQIKQTAENQRRDIEKQREQQQQKQKEMSSAVRKLRQQNIELINRNEALILNNNILKRKVAELLKVEDEQSMILPKQSLYLTTMEDSVEQFVLQKTMNIDLLKQIDKLHTDKQILINRLQQAEQNKIQMTNRLEKLFNKNLVQHDQIARLKEDNNHESQQIRRLNIQIENMRKLFKKEEKHEGERYKNQISIQKIQNQLGKELAQIVQQYKLFANRNENLNAQNQRLRHQLSIFQKNKSNNPTPKSAKILQTTRQMVVSQIYTHKQIVKNEQFKLSLPSFKKDKQEPKKKQGMNTTRQIPLESKVLVKTKQPLVVKKQEKLRIEKKTKK